MATILAKNKYGVAHQLPTSVGSVSEAFSIDGEEDLPACIVTTYKIYTSENVQFTPTIGEDLYIYILGTTPYDLKISGRLYNEDCSEDTSSEATERCIAKLLKKYEALKASKRTEPLKVSIGQAVFTVVLQDVTITGSSAESADVFEFAMTFKGVKI